MRSHISAGFIVSAGMVFLVAGVLSLQAANWAGSTAESPESWHEPSNWSGGDVPDTPSEGTGWASDYQGIITVTNDLVIQDMFFNGAPTGSDYVFDLGGNWISMTGGASRLWARGSNDRVTFTNGTVFTSEFRWGTQGAVNTNNVLTFGAGSVFTNTASNPQVGNGEAYDDNHLYLVDGAKAYWPDISSYIGNGGADDCSIVVDGTGSYLLYGTLAIGQGSCSGNGLVVRNGGLAELHSGGSVASHMNGISNYVHVLSGGELRSEGKTLTVGNAHADYNSMIVDGTNSLVKLSHLRAGYGNAVGNTITVRNGAEVDLMTGHPRPHLSAGYGNGGMSVSNSVIISGTGTAVRSNFGILIGDDENNTGTRCHYNLVEVKDGAYLRSNFIYIGDPSYDLQTNNELRVTSGASVYCSGLWCWVFTNSILTLDSGSITGRVTMKEDSLFTANGYVSDTVYMRGNMTLGEPTGGTLTVGNQLIVYSNSNTRVLFKDNELQAGTFGSAEWDGLSGTGNLTAYGGTLTLDFGNLSWALGTAQIFDLNENDNNPNGDGFDDVVIVGPKLPSNPDITFDWSTGIVTANVPPRGTVFVVR